jgi:hypothetical protein
VSVLPIEGFCWRDNFKARVGLEGAIVRLLIRWGLTEHAFDIYRKIEKQFNEALESFAWKSDSRFRLPKADRIQIQEILREHYLKTRDLPCRRAFKEKLHNGFLTGFEELSDLLVGLYEEYVHQFSRAPSREEAA